MDIIELYDDSGNLQKFELLDTFGMDDDNYAVMLPISEHNQMTYILKIKNGSNGEIIFEGIEDEKELNDAVEVYEQLKKENMQ
ncbi:DUF1292 domain-containing protein [Miniphocaeibacter massiliensis]|uniref:DUF1292 domain-containing protein n=1 Tax=Miniphocaeibacter massiliensis TaxID=2041841 RepID=UPI000C07B86C|nr:DUF1292 domain-containing protein [Miniphocaeibacter massiliensis]